MDRAGRSVDSALDEHVILALVFIEVPGRGYGWKLRAADGDTVAESPLFASLDQCLTDVRHSAPLNPGTDPYTRRR